MEDDQSFLQMELFYFVQGISKKNRDLGLLHVLHYFSSYVIENHPFKDLYLKIHTIGYYSGFYSSLNDKNWTNGGHFEFSPEDEEKDHICHICIQKSWKANDLKHSRHSRYQQKYLKPRVIQNSSKL